MYRDVVVSHPGRQHSHQLAAALASEGRLVQYYSGVPAGRKTKPWFLCGLNTNYADFHDDLPDQLCTCVPVSPIIRQIAMRVLKADNSVAVGHWADGVFDSRVRRRLARTDMHKVRVVVCYENAAESTFRWAKERGIVTVLDAASVHHSMQDAVVPFVESPATHARIVARKDREIALADWILTTSPLAAQSYLRAGVSQDRLRMIPMGVDLDNFRPVESGERSEELRFVFVGRASQLKGVDLLFETQRRLLDLGHRLRLTLIGDRDANVHVPDSPDITLIPRLSTRELAVELPKHDVLVLPSRFDSFGMVVPEAMACGLPVIVSPNAGSSMLVEPEQNGLVMADLTVDALESCMAWFLNNRDRLSNLAAHARKSLQAYTWNAYRARVRSVFSEICASQRT